MRFCFYVAQSGKPFNGQTLYTEALGGSESAVVYMARGLAKLGHEVIVFTRSEPGIYDDVLYLPFDSARSYLLFNPVDVLVCSRDPSPIYWSHRATCIIYWAHDLPAGPLPPNMNLYFFVSQWQANVYGQHGYIANPDTARISHNGVDLDVFKTKHEPRALTPEDEVNLAWTSNPERGLWYAGEVLQRVREVYPKAVLHVWGRNSIYGWDNSHEHVFYPDTLEGIVFHESTTKQGIANVLPTMDLLLYPTWWAETFCINTMEAQAVGLPIITSEHGALPETVKGGILVPGYAGKEGHIDALTNQTLKLLGNLEKRQELSRVGRGFSRDYGWDAQAKEWSELFSKALGLVA